MWEFAVMILMIIIVVWMMYSCECDKKAWKMLPAPAAEAPGQNKAPEVQSAATAAAEKKEGFCPKMAQRHGMCAGAESMNSRRGTFYNRKTGSVGTSILSGKVFEPMRSAPVGRGTMFERTQRANTLPL
jgi:hypothetical protein